MKTPNNILCMGVLSLVMASCDQSSKIEERNRTALLRANEELFGNWNFPYADESFSAEYSQPGFPGKGPELIKGYLAVVKEAFPDLTYKIDITAAEGDLVAWKRTHTATHIGDYFGYKATGKNLTWQEINFSRFTEDGKIAEEWGVSDFDVVVQRAAGIEGVYEYLLPGKGQGINRNGRFEYLFSFGNGPMTGQSGTYIVDGDIIRNTIIHSTNPKEVGGTVNWKAKSWSGDTLIFVILNEKGEPNFEVRGLRVSY